MITKYKDFINEGIRNEYSRLGVDNYYSTKKDEYTNPHIDNIQDCLDFALSKIDIGKFLDLSCGNGEISSYLNIKGLTDFIGCDPYFSEIYTNKLKKKCLNLSFQDISNNGLEEKFDTIICSYALQLCPRSYYANLLYQLSICTKYFIVISPSKYPIINDNFFELLYSDIINRTHIRIFKTK